MKRKIKLTEKDLRIEVRSSNRDLQVGDSGRYDTEVPDCNTTTMGLYCETTYETFETKCRCTGGTETLNMCPTDYLSKREIVGCDKTYVGDCNIPVTDKSYAAPCTIDAECYSNDNCALSDECAETEVCANISIEDGCTETFKCATENVIDCASYQGGCIIKTMVQCE